VTDLVTAAQASEILGVSRQAIHKWIISYKITKHVLEGSGKSLYSLADLQPYADRANRQVKPVKKLKDLEADLAATQAELEQVKHVLRQIVNVLKHKEIL
jgi:hypothetical protein